MNLNIATRSSVLALWQAEFVKNELLKLNPFLSIEIKKYTTSGDRSLETTLVNKGGKGLFVKEVEEAQLKGEADISVHCLKDLPAITNNHLEIGAFLKRERTEDALLSEKYASLKDLPWGAVVGTMSLRRKMQLLLKRPDLKIKALRGNVNRRLKKLKNGEYDAIVLAMAGVERLNLRQKVQYLDILDFIPSSGQGTLVIECVKKSWPLDLVRQLNDKLTFIRSTIERDFLTAIEANCSSCIAIEATIVDNEIVTVFIQAGLSDASEVLYLNQTFKIDQYKTIGNILAQKLIRKGLKAVLEREKSLQNTFKGTI